MKGLTARSVPVGYRIARMFAEVKGTEAVALRWLRLKVQKGGWCLQHAGPQLQVGGHKEILVEQLQPPGIVGGHPKTAVRAFTVGLT